MLEKNEVKKAVGCLIQCHYNLTNALTVEEYNKAESDVTYFRDMLQANKELVSQVFWMFTESQILRDYGIIS